MVCPFAAIVALLISEISIGKAMAFESAHDQRFVGAVFILRTKDKVRSTLCSYLIQTYWDLEECHDRRDALKIATCIGTRPPSPQPRKALAETPKF